MASAAAAAAGKKRKPEEVKDMHVVIVVQLSAGCKVDRTLDCPHHEKRIDAILHQQLASTFGADLFKTHHCTSRPSVDKASKEIKCKPCRCGKCKGPDGDYTGKGCTWCPCATRDGIRHRAVSPRLFSTASDSMHAASIVDLSMRLCSDDRTTVEMAYALELKPRVKKPKAAAGPKAPVPKAKAAPAAAAAAGAATASGDEKITVLAVVGYMFFDDRVGDEKSSVASDNALFWECVNNEEACKSSLVAFAWWYDKDANNEALDYFRATGCVILKTLSWSEVNKRLFDETDQPVVHVKKLATLAQLHKRLKGGDWWPKSGKDALRMLSA